jgi:uncharacterized membrane protein YhhN
VTAAAIGLFGLTVAVAIVDWVAVGRHQRSLELVAKPLTMVVLLGAVLTLEPTSSSARIAFAVAIVCSLVGDVLLMTKRDDLFVFGLGSFLAGHIAYIVGLWLLGTTWAWLVVGLVVMAIGLVAVGRPVVSGVRGGAHAELTGPVLAYMVVISVMVASAIGTHRPAAIVGAGLFYVSDALIAWNRFIEARPWGDLAIIVTYHLGQIGLALALVG